MAGWAGHWAIGWRGARRRLALTLAVFALVLQVNAPIHAAMMSAADADGGPAICAVHPAGKTPDKAPPAQHEACAACAVCALTGNALAPTVVAAILPPSVADAPLPLAGRSHAPRGPPRRKPQARGPPLFA